MDIKKGLHSWQVKHEGNDNAACYNRKLYFMQIWQLR